MRALFLLLTSALAASTIVATEVEPVSGVSELREKLALHEGTTVLNLWATWCLPCLIEIDDLETLSRDFADAGVSFVGLSIDDAATSDRLAAQQRVTTLLDRKRITYRNLYWLGSAEPLFRELEVDDGIPFTLVIDAEGRELWRHEGVIDPAELADVLRAAVARDAEQSVER